MKSDKTLEELDVILVELIHHIGKQVTDDYEMKNGLYEGMSIKNVLSKDKAQAALHRLILKERREELAGTDWGVVKFKCHNVRKIMAKVDERIAALNAEIEGSNHE